MRAFIHSFQGKPWNEECEAAYRGFTKLGVESILFTTNEELDQRNPEDVVVGGMLITGHVLSQYGITPENYNYPEELLEFCGRRIWNVKLKNLKEEKLPIFIKTAEEKAAKDIIVNSWADISEYEHLDPESEILCSEVMNFVSEWRCFVYYGEILGIQFYNGNKQSQCERSVVEAAVKTYSDIPAAYSLDFGVTDDGRTLLIEMNDGMAIGCYGLPDELYAKFLTARWAELAGCIDPWDIRVRQGYVEDFIREENDKVWNAYFSIDVKEKTGYEIVPEQLINYVKTSTQHLGLNKFFEQNEEREVFITDEYISLKEKNDLGTIIRAIIGKDVLVHLRVEANMIDTINQLLEEEMHEESQEDLSLIKWRYANDDYILELMKRLASGSTYLVRIYEDGNGVIIFSGREKNEICYFKMKDYTRKQIIDNAAKRMDEILAKPVWSGEDDRYFGFSVHLKYGLHWRCSDAEQRLKTYEKYEDIDYSDDEYELELAKQLLDIPEVKAKWMKMHGKSR